MAWHFRGRILGKQVEIKHLSNTALRSFVVATLSQITKYEVCCFCCRCWNSVLVPSGFVIDWVVQDPELYGMMIGWCRSWTVWYDDWMVQILNSMVWWFS